MTILITIHVAYTLSTIFSNPVHVTVSEYHLSLSVSNPDPLLNETIYFEGYLELNSTPVPDRIVTLFESNDDSQSWNAVDTTFTDAAGFYTFTRNMTLAGEFDYKTGFAP